MLCSLPPFYEEDRKDLFLKIKEGKVDFGNNDITLEARDIILRLLIVDPVKRLGSEGV